MSHLTTSQIVHNAWEAGVVVPAFNIPYLPMMPTVVKALRDFEAFGLIQVARLEFHKFEAGDLATFHAHYAEAKDETCTRLHLDHHPVIDEDHERVPYFAEIREAIELGFESVMVDGSRLSLDDNIAATKAVVDLAHQHGVPVEAELGAVMGHESGPMPPYEELFASGEGFTDPDEAARFVQETGTDWLSVAVGSIHGAISGAAKDKQKVAARLSIPQLDAIREKTGIPLVLHGGTGIQKECLQESFQHGIAKINIATAIRQPYEQALRESGSTERANEAVYEAMRCCLEDELAIAGTLGKVMS